jgi:CheY-like chemotaxis protein
MLPKVFDVFTQVDRSIARSHGGLGIGLTLVRRLVAMHGGTCEAHSDGPDKGSEFVVRLPLALAPTQQQSVAMMANEKSNQLSSHRILVVDDNLDSAQSLAMVLRVTGNEVRVAHDGQTALQVGKEFRPELVLLDIGLPGMDGYEVARRMREMPETKDSLLVAQTGWGQEEDRRRSKDAGFHHHLVKPLEPGAVQALLETLSGNT